MIRTTWLNYRKVCFPSTSPVIVTVENIREYLTRSKSTVTSQGFVVNKNIMINNLPPRLRLQH